MANFVDINTYVALIYSSLFFVVIAILYYYAEPGFPWHTYITLTIGYYCAFGILLLVPLDMAVVITDRKSNVSGSDSFYNADVNILATAYNVFFTIVLIMGSVILSFEEYYNTDGKSIYYT